MNFSKARKYSAFGAARAAHNHAHRINWKEKRHQSYRSKKQV